MNRNVTIKIMDSDDDLTDYDEVANELESAIAKFNEEKDDVNEFQELNDETILMEELDPLAIYQVT